jgi:hypothetical protein
LRPTPNLEDQVSVFMFPSDRVAQLYPQAPVSFFVASYNSQSYGGGILTGLNTEISEESIYGSTVLLLDIRRFFSFLMLYTVGRTPWTGDQPIARPRYLHTEHKQRINAHNTDIHALSGIRTHDPNFRASEDSSCLRLRDHYDRQFLNNSY